MKTLSDEEMALTRIRNCYNSIQMLTIECLGDDDPESIATLMRNRSEIMGLIASEEQKMGAGSAPGGKMQSLRDEIRSIIASIVILDQQLDTLIRGKLNILSCEMTKLYKKSRAASAYTAQSRR